MNTQPTPGVVGPLITSYLATHSDRDFAKILKKFTPQITAIAGTFPKDWNEDYVQEGRIGLYNALKTCPAGLPLPEILLYTSRAIKSKMIDFYRSTVGRFQIEVDIHLDDGSILIAKQPGIVQYPDFPYDSDDDINPIESYTRLPEYASTLELAIDIKYLLSERQLKQLKLTDSEIRIIDLYYRQGYNTSTVSQFLHTSVSNASKIITKANTKVKPYLLIYQSN